MSTCWSRHLWWNRVAVTYRMLIGPLEHCLEQYGPGVQNFYACFDILSHEHTSMLLVKYSMPA
jgi:hypothetical protein